jgi:hypothetical protein
MTEDSIGVTPTPNTNPEASATTPEPESDDIEFTPEQKKKLGKILSAERSRIKEQFADYDGLKAKLKEIEKSKLSESQQLQLERDEAKKETEATKKRLEKFEALELRTKLFSDYKTKGGDPLPSNLLKYVKGKNEEEILGNIESIAADFGLKLEKRRNIGNPTPAGGEAPPNKNDFINAQIMSMAGRGGR